MPNEWGIHNFNAHTAGDGFKGERLRLRAADLVTPVALPSGTGLLYVHFRDASADGALLQECTVENGLLTVNSHEEGDFNIHPFSLAGWPTGNHPWGFQAQLPGEPFPTHLVKGVLPVTDEIVREP